MPFKLSNRRHGNLFTIEELKAVAGEYITENETITSACKKAGYASDQSYHQAMMADGHTGITALMKILEVSGYEVRIFYRVRKKKYQSARKARNPENQSSIIRNRRKNARGS